MNRRSRRKNFAAVVDHDPAIDRRSIHVEAASVAQACRLGSSSPLVEVVTCFALTSAVLSTVLSAVIAAVVTAAGVDQLVDFGVALVFGRGHHWHRQLPLGSVTCLHDLADA